jgi:hypothetical protein
MFKTTARDSKYEKYGTAVYHTTNAVPAVAMDRALAVASAAVPPPLMTTDGHNYNIIRATVSVAARHSTLFILIKNSTKYNMGLQRLLQCDAWSICTAHRRSSRYERPTAK